MPVITAKELADICSIKPKNIHTYAGRGKLIKRSDGLFDTNNPINSQFIDKFTTGNSVSGEIVNVNEKKTATDINKSSNDSEPSSDDYKPKYTSASKLNDLRARKLQEEITQLSLKNQRLEGELIEVSIIEKATIEVIKAYRSTLFISAENVLKNNMIDLGADNDKLTKAVADLQALFNAGCANAIEQTKQVIVQML